MVPTCRLRLVLPLCQILWQTTKNCGSSRGGFMCPLGPQRHQNSLGFLGLRPCDGKWEIKLLKATNEEKLFGYRERSCLPTPPSPPNPNDVKILWQTLTKKCSRLPTRPSPGFYTGSIFTNNKLIDFQERGPFHAHEAAYWGLGAMGLE